MLEFDTDNIQFYLTYLFDSIYFELLLSTFEQKFYFQELRAFSASLEKIYMVKEGSKESLINFKSQNFLITEKSEALLKVKFF